MYYRPVRRPRNHLTLGTAVDGDVEVDVYAHGAGPLWPRMLMPMQSLSTPHFSREAIGCEPLGEGGALVRLADEIGRDAHERVRAFCAKLEQQPPPGLIEYVPAYTTVALYYDPLRVDYEDVRDAAQRIAAQRSNATVTVPNVIEIPVCYGSEYGPDLEAVAAHHGISPDDVVALHQGAEYEVWMLGFAPGFAYLGGLPERIATPRRATPRVKVPAGSVGIAGAQTGVYPFDSPGGWQLIGRTPLRMFDPTRSPPALLEPGDRVRFRAITPAEFEALWRA